MKAVFLDKDGTLIHDVPYNVDPDAIQLTPGAASGLWLLHSAGYQLIVVSNQSGVARGYFPETALIAVERRIRQLLKSVGVPLAGFYYCPHYLGGKVAKYTIACDCRKPEPGMLLRAAVKHHLDLKQCWMIGDILNDIEAGQRAGCQTVLVDNGNETEWILSSRRIPDYQVNNLAEAACLITGCSEAIRRRAVSRLATSR